MKNELIPGNALTLREAHGLLRAKLTHDGHPPLVSRYASGLIILGGLIEYDALVAGYRRVGALVVSKVPLSMRGEERRFVPIHRTKDWESTRALWLSDGSSVG